MNKEQFLTKMKIYLRSIPEPERNELLADYESHFDSALEEGKSQEQVAKALGNPKILAAEIKADYYIENANQKNTISNVFSAVLAAAALGFFNLVFVLGPFFGFIGILISFWSVSAALFISGFVGALASLYSVLFKHSFFDIAQLDISFPTLFFGLISISLTGFFMCILCYYLTKSFFMLTVKYLKWNLNIISQRRIEND